MSNRQRSVVPPYVFVLTCAIALGLLIGLIFTSPSDPVCDSPKICGIHSE